MILPSVRRRKDRGNFWYAYFRVNGVQKQCLIPNSLSLGRKAVQEAAIAVAEAYIASKPNTPTIPIPPPNKPSERLLEAEFQRWLRLTYAFQKPKTVEAVKGEWKAFAKHLEIASVMDLTPAEASKAVESILASGITPRYWLAVLGTVKRFCTWLVEDGQLSVNPVGKVKYPSSRLFKKTEEVWEEGEIQATAKFLSSHDRNIFLLMRYTGMYPADVFEFAKKHVMPDKESGYKIYKLRAKAKHPSEIIDQPLLPQVEEIIMAAYKAATDPDALLFMKPGLELRAWRDTFREHVAAAYRRAFPGKQAKQIKSLRHTFATWLMENDIPIDVAKRWMGHSPNSTLLEAVYTHRQSAVKYTKRLV